MFLELRGFLISVYNSAVFISVIIIIIIIALRGDNIPAVFTSQCHPKSAGLLENFSILNIAPLPKALSPAVGRLDHPALLKVETNLQLLKLLFVCTLNQSATLMDENFYHGFMEYHVLLRTLRR